jgi:hypothetical protein
MKARNEIENPRDAYSVGTVNHSNAANSNAREGRRIEAKYNENIRCA